MAKKAATTIKSGNKKKVDKFDFLEAYALNPNVNQTKEQLISRFKVIEKEIREKHPNHDELKNFADARQRIYSEIKAQLKNKSSVWLYNPLCFGYPFDFGTPHYDRNMDFYDRNQKKAEEKGYVKVIKNPAGKVIKVIPLEERESRKSHSQELKKPAYISTIAGIAMPFKAFENTDKNDKYWETLKPFQMSTYSPFADPNSKSFVFDKMERGQWYKIKVNNISKKEDDFYNFSFSSVSNFNTKTDVVEPLTIDDIRSYFIDRYRKLGELEDWHESNATMGDDGVSSNNYDVVLTEGIVQSIDEADENSNSHKITIDDAESMSLDDDDITIWYDKHFSIDFSVYSRVLVFGTTRRKEKQDLATEEYTGEMGSVQLTGLGFIVLDAEEPEEIESEVAGDEEEYAEVEEDVESEVENEEENEEENDEVEDEEENDDSSSSTDEEWS